MFGERIVVPEPTNLTSSFTFITSSFVKENISAADKEKVIILAEAYKTAEQIRGDGDARAAAIYAESFSKDPEFYEFTRSMRAYDATFNNKSDVLLIDPKSDFFKYLNKSKGDN